MLDPKGKREIRELTNELRKNNPELTILSITHDIEEALQSDRVIVLNSGQVVLNGKPEVVFENKDKLREVKLDIPFGYKLNEVLNNKGIKVESLDLEGMVKELCQ